MGCGVQGSPYGEIRRGDHPRGPHALVGFGAHPRYPHSPRTPRTSRAEKLSFMSGVLLSRLLRMKALCHLRPLCTPLSRLGDFEGFAPPPDSGGPGTLLRGGEGLEEGWVGTELGAPGQPAHSHTQLAFLSAWLSSGLRCSFSSTNLQPPNPTPRKLQPQNCPCLCLTAS